MSRATVHRGPMEPFEIEVDPDELEWWRVTVHDAHVEVVTAFRTFEFKTVPDTSPAEQLIRAFHVIRSAAKNVSIKRWKRFSISSRG